MCYVNQLRPQGAQPDLEEREDVLLGERLKVLHLDGVPGEVELVRRDLRPPRTTQMAQLLGPGRDI